MFTIERGFIKVRHTICVFFSAYRGEKLNKVNSLHGLIIYLLRRLLLAVLWVVFTDMWPGNAKSGHLSNEDYFHKPNSVVK